MNKPRASRDQPEFDFKVREAKEARDEAFEVVIGNTPEWWASNYVRLMSERRCVASPFSGEDFRIKAIGLIGHPHHHNSWGAHWNVAIAKGWVIGTGEWKHMWTRKSHARKTPLYRWPGEGIEVAGFGPEDD